MLTKLCLTHAILYYTILHYTILYCAIVYHALPQAALEDWVFGYLDPISSAPSSEATRVGTDICKCFVDLYAIAHWLYDTCKHITDRVSIVSAV